MSKIISVKSKSTPTSDELHIITENELIDLAKWAIISLKIPGYFPLRVKFATEKSDFLAAISSQNLKTYPILTNPKQLQKPSYFDIQFIYSILLFLASIVLEYNSICSGIEAASIAIKDDRNRSLFSASDNRLLFTYNGIFLTLMTIVFRIGFFGWNKNILGFWRHLVTLLKGFEEVGLFRGCSYFKEVESGTKKEAFKFLTVAVSQSVMSFGLLLVLKRLMLNDIYLPSWALGLGIIYFHVGFVVWVGFFITMYKACFQAISEGIRDLGSNLNLTETKAAQGRLFRLLDLYELTCEEIERFNRFYGPPIIIEVGICLANLFTCVYSANKLILDTGELSWEWIVMSLLQVFPQGLFILRLMFLTGQGSLVVEEGLKVLRALQKMPGNIADLDIQLYAKTQTLVTRMSVNPPGIYPGNLFPMNKKGMVSVLSILATYSLVLGQLREEHEGRNLIRSLIRLCSKN